MTPPAQGELAITASADRSADAPLAAAGTRRVAKVLGSEIDVVDVDTAIERISEWSMRKESRAVYLCNVHSVVTARQDASFGRVVQAADMALPDGAPIAWSLRQAGFAQQGRLSGPDVMWQYLARAEDIGAVVSFYGSTPSTLEALRAALLLSFPALKIGAMLSPPFRQISAAEDSAYTDQLHAAGTNTLFVALGCPKQERWIDEHRGVISAVMLGVGAAFSFHAGQTSRAPLWMQRNGMEWLHRLYQEPKRLAVRYLVTNSVFIALTIKGYVVRSSRRPH